MPALGQVVQLAQRAQVAEEALGSRSVGQREDGLEKVARVFRAPLGGVDAHDLLLGRAGPYLYGSIVACYYATTTTEARPMQLIPAIDLLDGRVVRLSKGAYDAVTEYGDDPVAVAGRWAEQGAERIHIVDLDAAREGRPMQAGVIARMVESVDVPCQVAGGIRDADAVAGALHAGAERVVLGSALISHPLLARTLTERYGPDRIVAALDVRDGQALGDGWVADARGAEVIGLARSLAEAGVRWFAVTAIARDGQMNGPDLDLLEAVREAVPGAAIIASGGVSSLADIRELAARRFDAAITGKALYEGAFTLPEALVAARTT